MTSYMICFCALSKQYRYKFRFVDINIISKNGQKSTSPVRFRAVGRKRRLASFYFCLNSNFEKVRKTAKNEENPRKSRVFRPASFKTGTLGCYGLKRCNKHCGNQAGQPPSGLSPQSIDMPVILKRRRQQFCRCRLRLGYNHTLFSRIFFLSDVNCGSHYAYAGNKEQSNPNPHHAVVTGLR